jgi:hypothetical protein
MILDKGTRRGLQQQVNVVAHENIRIHLEAIPPPILLQPFQIILPIRITPKDHLALIATANDMVKSPKKFHPWFTRHRACLWQYLPQ